MRRGTKTTAIKSILKKCIFQKVIKLEKYMRALVLIIRKGACKNS